MPPRPACCVSKTCSARCVASCARWSARPTRLVGTATSSTELGALQIFLRGREIASLRSRLAALAGDNLSLHAAEQAAPRRACRVSTPASWRPRPSSRREAISICRDEMVRVEQLRERARGIAAVLVERRRSMERDRGQLMDSGVVANLEADAENLRERVAASGRRPRRARARGRANRCRGGSVRPGASADVVDDRRRHQLLRGERRRRGARRAALAARRAPIGPRASCSACARDATCSAIGSAGSMPMPRRCVIDCEQAQSIEAGLVDRSRGCRGAPERRRRRSRRGDRGARQTAADDVSRWDARAEALSLALESARARAGAEHLAGVDDVLGTLLDLIDIDSGWEAAVEAALGEAVEAVVVASPSRRSTSARVAACVERARRRARPRDGASPSPVLPSTGGASVAATRPQPARRRCRVARCHRRVGSVRSDVDRGRRSGDQEPAGGRRHRRWRPFRPDGVARRNRRRRRDRVGAGGSTRNGSGSPRQNSSDASVAEQVGLGELQAARSREADLSRRLDSHDAGFSASSEALARTQSERRDTQAELETVGPYALDRGDRAAESRAPANRRARGTRTRARGGRSRGGRGSQVSRRDPGAARRPGRAAGQSPTRLEVRSAGLNERQQFLERRLHETERRLEADVARSRPGRASTPRGRAGSRCGREPVCARRWPSPGDRVPSQRTARDSSQAERRGARHRPASR